MNVITHNKLVRDRIPEIIEAEGKTCETEILSDEEYLKLLDAKMTEELAEYYKEHDIGELADFLELIYASAESLGYTPEELEARREKKAASNGAFKKKIYLKTVTEP